MKQTGFARLSLFYLATYLALTGIGLLVWPQGSLRLLAATQTYAAPFVQFTGAFMVALAVIVIQIIRYRLSVLHPTTLIVRLFFIAVISRLYAMIGDRPFLVIAGVVCLGVCLTLAGLALDRRADVGTGA